MSNFRYTMTNEELQAAISALLEYEDRTLDNMTGHMKALLDEQLRRAKEVMKDEQPQ